MKRQMIRMIAMSAVIFCMASPRAAWAQAVWAQAAQAQAARAQDARAQDDETSQNNLTGAATLRYDIFTVNEDTGRFREDNWRTDQSTGGLDWLGAETKEPDEKGRKWRLDGRALYDYDYAMKLLMEKEGEYYLKLDFEGRRRYYDGSNEFWDTSLYGLAGNYAEFSDKDFYVDRRDYNIEFGITPAEDWELIFGWRRQVKDGKEVLLFGGEADGGLLPDFRGIPPVQNMRGITDTFYGEAAKTFADKYNFRFRQEFEQHHDDQLTKFVRFDPDVTSYETYDDDPGYTNWRSMFMFDSFLDEETYVTANYMYDYLNNDGTRNVILPFSGPPERFTNNRVGNSRKTNAGAVGYQKINLFPNLHFTGSVRVENSRSRSKSSGLEFGGMFEAWSEEREVRVAENIRFTYDGIARTILTFDADLEQRQVDWNENNDGERWKADVDHTDQNYEIKAVHRFNRSAKTTFAYRHNDRLRSYRNIVDDDHDEYPGFLGTYRIKGDEVLARADWRVNNRTDATLMFEFIQESIDTHVGGKTQNLEIYRGSGSISTAAASNLFVVGTFMLENYSLDTPAVGDSTFGNIAAGSRPFDFGGNSFSILLDGQYAFNSKTSCVFGYRHTEGLATVDFGGDYAYDSVALTLKHRLAANQHVSVGYQLINFNNHPGGSFDDYTANGVLLTYTCTF